MFGGGLFGGHRAPGAVQGSFDYQYQVFPVTFMGKEELDKGNMILLPESALDKLARLNISWPMLFEMTNPATARSTHGGVQEFIADEGTCFFPCWMMQNLLLQEGDLVRITNTSLPKGSFVKLQPVHSDFLDIHNPRAVLKHSLRNFATLTVGDCIVIDYNQRKYEIEIVECKPAKAISIIEANVNVDFAPPKDYKADKASEEVKKDGAAGSGVVAVRHQRESSKEAVVQAAKELQEATTSKAESSVKLEPGHGARLAMFSARFNEKNKDTETKFRAVHKILVDNHYEVLMVEAGEGENFGEKTVKYLNRLKREKGIMLAVCTSDYGEMTDLPFCTYYELKSAVEYKIDVLPLQVEDIRQPNPPCGKGYLDEEELALGYIDLVFTPSTVQLDCRNKPVEEIAGKIAAVLRKPLVDCQKGVGE